MKHIVFAPPKETQIEIEIRGSMLNSFLNPSPYEFKDMDNKVECMNIGDRYHSVLQATMLMGKAKGMWTADRHIRELNNMMPFTREKEILWFINGGAHQLVDYISDKSKDPTIFNDEENNNKIVCNYVEEKRQIIIDFSGYLVNFSGTSDADCNNLIYEGEERGHMIDLKSAGSKWSQDKADEERQKYYYVYLKCVLEGLPGCRFDYYVYTKQKKVQEGIFTYYISKEEAENVLKRDLKYYLISLNE